MKRAKNGCGHIGFRIIADVMIFLGACHSWHVGLVSLLLSYLGTCHCCHAGLVSLLCHTGYLTLLP
jgi:hypothetical protein